MRLIGDYRFHGELSPAEQDQFARELSSLLEHYRVARVDVTWEREAWPERTGAPKGKTFLQRVLGSAP